MQLESARLTLRDFVLEDWAAVHEWAVLPEAIRFQAWGPNTPEETRAHVQRAIQATQQQPRTDYTLAAVLDATGRVIGSGSLLVRSERFRTGEIAYILHPDFWNQGFGTEIALSLLGFGFEQLHLHRIAATCDPRNIASGRVLQKAGLTYEGRLRQTLLIRDGWRDSDCYAILEHEWEALCRHDKR